MWHKSWSIRFLPIHAEETGEFVIVLRSGMLIRRSKFETICGNQRNALIVWDMGLGGIGIMHSMAAGFVVIMRTRPGK